MTIPLLGPQKFSLTPQSHPRLLKLKTLLVYKIFLLKTHILTPDFFDSSGRNVVRLFKDAKNLSFDNI